jgi:hypothetical protein
MHASAGLCALLFIPPLGGKVLLQEDFEGDNPRKFVVNVTNSKKDIEVHFAGVSEERAASGKKSFKIDMTVPDGGFVYWTLPAEFPFTHPMKVEGKVRLEGDMTALFGFYYKNTVVDISDWTKRAKSLVLRADKAEQEDSLWKSLSAYEPRLSLSEQPLVMESIALFVYPWPAQQFDDTRVVVFVDDLKVVRTDWKLQEPEGETIRNVDGYNVFPVSAITDEKILSKRPLIPNSMKLKSLEMTAAGDEYESMSFVIVSSEKLDDVAVTLDPFRLDDHELNDFDLFAVKCWYQPYVADLQYGPPITTLTSELLLHDDELVTVDLVNHRQHIRVTMPDGESRRFDISGPNSDLKREYIIEDADALLPVDIERMQPKQFWLTIHVPADSPPGEYRSTLHIRPKKSPFQDLPVTLNVLPFNLPAPSLEYSHYYRAQLKNDDIPLIGSDLKTEKQLEAEFRDTKAHGVANPNVYQPIGKGLERYLEIRNRVGLSKDRLFLLTDPSTDPEVLDEGMRIAKRFGYPDVYLYGWDEATGDRLLQQRPAWQQARARGFKIFVACYAGDNQGRGDPGFFPLVGDILDAPIVAGPAKLDLAEKVRRNGFRMYMYANPQYGQPNPETYRRNFGLGLWKGGYSGAMDYAYQHEQAGIHIWNDMATGILDRMTYPTSSGVIPTMAWEGFREGVDDVRYVTHLENLLDEAERERPDAPTVQETRMWLKRLDLSSNLDLIRRRIQDRILQLGGATAVD